MPELFSSMTSVFIADIICYPLETVLDRLYIQGFSFDLRYFINVFKGTRTLVDNLDSGAEALVPTGRYTGVYDCFSSIIRKEGILTLFRFFFIYLNKNFYLVELVRSFYNICFNIVWPVLLIGYLIEVNTLI
jgi:hypothetical protein